MCVCTHKNTLMLGCPMQSPNLPVENYLHIGVPLILLNCLSKTALCCMGFTYLYYKQHFEETTQNHIIHIVNKNSSLSKT
jgi:hypothetical protein